MRTVFMPAPSAPLNSVERDRQMHRLIATGLIQTGGFFFEKALVRHIHELRTDGGIDRLGFEPIIITKFID